MAIYFTSEPMNLPIFVYCIGNHWYQSAVRRDSGYPYYQWLQTERGEGVINISGRTIKLKQGCGILMSPFIAHKYQPTDNDWLTSFVSFQGTMQNDLGLITGHQPYILAENGDSFSPQAWIDKMVPQFEKGTYDPDELSIECYRFLLGINRSQVRQISSSQHKYLKYIEPVLGEISQNYSSDITVQQLADQVYVTPQYLSRLFQRYIRTTTHDYLTNYRIKMAKELLLNRPELSVRDVGILTGMTTISHFIAVFKASVGYTPHEFRNLHY